ncbi:MAG TPA: hypothetical protein VIY71_01005, partial [Solirubrobacterales bacterium]
ARGRIYWSNFTTGKVSYAGLDGGAGHDIDTSGATIEGPEGVAIDSRIGRVYWANQAGNSIGYAGVDGGGGGTANLNQFVSNPIGLATDGSSTGGVGAPTGSKPAISPPVVLCRWKRRGPRRAGLPSPSSSKARVTTK